MSEQGSPMSDRGEGDRPRVRERFGIGEVVPDSFTAAVERQFRAEYERREAELRAELTGRVAAVLEEHRPVDTVLDDGEELPHWKACTCGDCPSLGYGQHAAELAVDVFTAWVREGQVSRPASAPWASWGGDGVGP